MTNRKSRNSAQSSQFHSESAKKSRGSKKKSTQQGKLRGLLVEQLERRDLMANDLLQGIFAQGTTDDYRNHMTQHLNARAAGD